MELLDIKDGTVRGVPPRGVTPGLGGHVLLGVNGHSLFLPQILGVPATKLGVSASKLGVPDTKLGVPGSKLGIPDTKLEVPATKLGVPDTKLEVSAPKLGFHSPLLLSHRMGQNCQTLQL